MTTFAGQLSLPRGLRNNNVGNIRPNPNYTWYGQTGVSGGYCVFASVEDGIRAMGKDLRTKIVKDRLNEIATYIPRYAPESDNNDTAAYISTVSELSGIPATQPLTADPLTLFKLIKAHIHVEVGAKECVLITDSMINAGIALM